MTVSNRNFLRRAQNRLFLEISHTSRKLCNIFPSSDELTIVTGASSNHFKSLLQLLESIYQYEKADVVVWDLGLTPDEATELLNKFPTIKHYKFDYSKYPDYFSIAAGENAWKAAVIQEIYAISKFNLLWLDAGCVIDHRLNTIRYLIKMYGFYCPFSQGTIEQWTHKNTINYFKLTRNIKNKYLLSSGIVGCNKKSKKSKLILSEWYKHSFTRDAIAPIGSNRQNHRQDQSLLSILFYKYFRKNPFLCRYLYNIKTHRDIG